MFRSSRKVKPEDNESSSDSEGISSLAYRFRGTRNSKVSRIFDDKQEIEFIEKRFQDTAFVIFKEVDELNRLLLRKSYKAVFRSDIVAIGGRNLRSGTTARKQKHEVKENHQTKPVQTIDEVWEPKMTIVNGHSTNFANNAVSPEVRSSGNTRRKGMCRVT